MTSWREWLSTQKCINKDLITDRKHGFCSLKHNRNNESQNPNQMQSFRSLQKSTPKQSQDCKDQLHKRESDSWCPQGPKARGFQILRCMSRWKEDYGSIIWFCRRGTKSTFPWDFLWPLVVVYKRVSCTPSNKKSTNKSPLSPAFVWPTPKSDGGFFVSATSPKSTNYFVLYVHSLSTAFWLNSPLATEHRGRVHRINCSSSTEDKEEVYRWQ